MKANIGLTLKLPVLLTSLILLVVNSFVTSAVAAEELGCLSGDCENGKGTMVLETELGLERYVGSFINGEYHGYGRLTRVNEKNIYKGNWLMGKRNGRGVYWDKSNNVYMGQWRNDRRNGVGAQFYGVKDWKEGAHGESWLKENTENYVGDFQNDVFNGQGTYRWPDGVKYVGAWAANKKHGVGYFDYGTGYRANRKYEFDVKVFDYDI